MKRTQLTNLRILTLQCVLAAGAAILLAAPIQAQTVSGALTANETWSGTVTLEGDVTVPEEITLTIAPGTKVLSKRRQDTTSSGLDKSAIEIVLNGGNLVASGTASNPIVFSTDSTAPEPGDWYGIRTIQGNLTLKHFQIYWAGRALRLEDTDNRFEIYDVSDGLIQNSQATGIFGASGDNRLAPYVFTRVKIQDTKAGQSGNGNGDAIYTAGPIELVDCEIVASAQEGLRLAGGSATLLRTSLMSNDDGIFLDGPGSLDITDSVIQGNRDEGIEVDCCNSQVTIKGSQIRENGTGANGNGIYFRNGNLAITDTVIASNVLWGIYYDGAGIFEVRGSTSENNASGIYAGTSSITVTVAKSIIRSNKVSGLQLDFRTNAKLSDEGIIGNLIAQNGVGIRVDSNSSGIRTLNFSGNDIIDNKVEVANDDNEITVVANGNHWGAVTLAELARNQLNLTAIKDIRDGRLLKQVLIDTWYDSSVVTGNGGPLQKVDYSRPDVTQVISGEITSRQTWSGKVLLTGDTTITATGLVIIQPGTIVEFELLRDTQASGLRLSRTELILAGGALLAEGTAEAPIVFTSSTPASRPEEDRSGDFLGIRVADGDLSLRHFVISYAEVGLEIVDSDNRFDQYDIADGLIRNSWAVGFS